MTRPHVARLRAAALLGLLMLLPGCVTPSFAGTSDAPDGVLVPPLHVGDTLSYHQMEYETKDGAEPGRGEGNVTLGVEGPARAADRFDIERDTVAIRVDDIMRTRDERHTCHLLAGGVENVRWDTHEGYSYRIAAGIHGLELPGARAFEGFAFFGGTCYLLPAMVGRTWSEGDVASSEPVDDVGYFWPLFSDSAPAVAIEHDGRRGVRFTWTWDMVGERGTVDVDFLEGIPSYARLKWHTWGDGWTWGGDWRLTGFSAGNGTAVVDEGVRLPARHSDADFAPFDPMALDDTALGLRYPFAEALDALRSDPVIRLDAWLAQHPDARLARANYWATTRGMESERAMDGGWLITYTTADSYARFGTERFSTDAAGVPLPDALKPTRNEVTTGTRPLGMPYPQGELDEIAASAHLVRMAESLVPPGDIRRLSYVVLGADPGGPLMPFLIVDNLNATFGTDEHGKMVYLDVATGGLVSTWNGTRTGRVALLAAPGEVAPREQAPAPALLSDIGWRQAVAAPAAIALILILAKLALALYTRLTRDSILDNPVRARLYERIRAEPGIHREELIDFGGIGNGATRHHLRKLVAHGFALEITAGRFARYYAAGEVPAHVAREHALLRVGRAQEVYDVLIAEPRLSLREAALRLNMSAPSVHRIRRRLAAAGLLKTR